MKPHPRIRTAVKWGGAAVTTVLVVVWIGSGWWDSEMLTHGGCQGWVSLGAVGFGNTGVVGFEDLGFRRLGPESVCKWSWWFYFFRDREVWLLVIPIWILLLPSATCTALAWRFDTLARRRARLNLCPRCRYDRTGLAASAKCPECGAPA